MNNTFSTQGNIEIAAFNPTPEIIQKLHKEARDIEAERMKEAVAVQEAPYEAPRMRLR